MSPVRDLLGGRSSTASVERFVEPAVIEEKRRPRDTSRMMGGREEGDMVRVVRRDDKPYSLVSGGDIWTIMCRQSWGGCSGKRVDIF